MLQRSLYLAIPALWFREGSGTPLQYSCLENPMEGGAWWVEVHGVAKSRIRLSDFTFTFHFHALEKAMATHSSVLAWRIPGTGEPGGLLSMGSHRVGHDWSDLATAAAPWLEFSFNIWDTCVDSWCTSLPYMPAMAEPGLCFMWIPWTNLKRTMNRFFLTRLRYFGSSHSGDKG